MSTGASVSTSVSTPGLRQVDIDALYLYAAGEHVHEVALFLDLSLDETGIKLANLCGMRRDRAFQLALTARSTS